ncbi:hypothetical protein KO500_04065 [Cellulophaga baltica]|uniref:hypothetical protein n=1 Tax=Cellulophaga TaxID=104264 RepID=UPI001C072E39|nr:MULTISPECIES: hypothetical protein [Cellulophaga]MBU2995590.1 hypothetical protein [Cellulophaga baltica]MDO6766984.1 hypothetical protein [Cellulophaga sp. 1_MG-2023]
MRQLILTSIFTLIALTAFAKNNNVTSLDASRIIIEPKTDAFIKITEQKLPELVLKTITKNFPSAKIDEAFVNDKKHYKLKLSLTDGASGVLYTDENGEWLNQ